MTDHPDIVERLRDKSGKWINGLYDEEAAAEITRLRAEAEALKKAAVELLYAVDTRHENVPPLKYTIPYAGVNALRAAIAASKEQQA